MKTQIKTALLFTGLTGGLMSLLCILVYYFATNFAFRDFNKRLELRAVIAAKVFLEQDESSTASFSEMKKKHLEVLPFQKEYFLKIDSATGKIHDDQGLPLPKSFYNDVMVYGSTFYMKNEVSYAGIYYPDNQGNFIVVASAINEYETKALYNLKTIFIICLIGGMAIAFTVGIFFSHATFQPVRRIIKQVKSISAQNLHLRLKEGKEGVGKDEMTELSNTFNNMLDRLETAFETQSNFISNASHELRTPLTTIIGEADLALHKDRDPEAYRASLTVILQEANRLQKLTTGLLNLAQSSFDGTKQSWEEIRVDELIFEIKEEVARIEPLAKLEVNLSKLPEDAAQLCIFGNKQLLKLALSNIVLNGFKYSGNMPVKISIVYEYKKLSLIFEDQGIGIPQNEIRHVFDPFFRASNVSNFAGHGIGLPLTMTILRLHNATIEIHSIEDVGTTVTTSFTTAI